MKQLTEGSEPLATIAGQLLNLVRTRDSVVLWDQNNVYIGIDAFGSGVSLQLFDVFFQAFMNDK